MKDGNAAHITREPEQVKAFRDTWRDGIHSYLSYLRDRLTVARDLLSDSGSIFVQIGDENVHRVRALMDEVFGRTILWGKFLSGKLVLLQVVCWVRLQTTFFGSPKIKTLTKYRPPLKPRHLSKFRAVLQWVELPDGERRSLTKKSGMTYQCCRRIPAFFCSRRCHRRGHRTTHLISTLRVKCIHATRVLIGKRPSKDLQISGVLFD